MIRDPPSGLSEEKDCPTLRLSVSVSNASPSPPAKAIDRENAWQQGRSNYWNLKHFALVPGSSASTAMLLSINLSKSPKLHTHGAQLSRSGMATQSRLTRIRRRSSIREPIGRAGPATLGIFADRRTTDHRRASLFGVANVSSHSPRRCDRLNWHG